MSDPHVVNEFKRAVRATGAGPKITKALFESGIVESHLQNLNYGDRDSKGALQQRVSQGWTHATDPYGAAVDFINHAKAVEHAYGDAGSLAQAVQRSAFPARYGAVAAEADQIRKGLSKGSSSSRRTATTPAKTTVDKHQAVVDALLAARPGQRIDAGQLLSKIAAGQYTTTTPAKTKTTPSSGSSAAAGHDTTDTSGKNLGDFEGKPVAGWIAGVLKRARAAGWTGTVNSGYRSLADQTRIYNSGVRPAAKPGTSNHEMTAFPGGAVDVTQAAQLSQILKKIGVTKLQWAGAKDPVHFSHPHNGSY